MDKYKIVDRLTLIIAIIGVAYQLYGDYKYTDNNDLGFYVATIALIVSGFNKKTKEKDIQN